MFAVTPSCTVNPSLISFLEIIWHNRGPNTTVAFRASKTQANWMRMGKKKCSFAILLKAPLIPAHNTGGSGRILEFQINCRKGEDTTWHNRSWHGTGRSALHALDQVPPRAMLSRGWIGDSKPQKARNKLPENGSTFIIISGASRMVSKLAVPRPSRTSLV